MPRKIDHIRNRVSRSVVLPGFVALSFAYCAFAQKSPQADVLPRLVGQFNYVMPDDVMDEQIFGRVRVEVTVDEKGVPTKAEVISGPMWPCGALPYLALLKLSSSISDAVMKLRFSPGIRNGQPAVMRFAMSFDLANTKMVVPTPERDPATGKLRPQKVVGGVLNGKATSLFRPAYPQEAREVRQEGTVIIEVLVDEEGKVISAGAVKGPVLLQDAARDAACKSKFSPTLLSGSPVKVSGTITYNFAVSR